MRTQFATYLAAITYIANPLDGSPFGLRETSEDNGITYDVVIEAGAKLGYP